MSALLALLVALQAPAPAPAPEASPPAPEASPPVEPQPDPDEPPKRYGDRGTSHIGLGLGLGSGSGGFRYVVGGEYGYFVVGGLAPGAEVMVSGGTGLLTTGLVLGTLRWLPIRTDRFSLFVVGRGGRVLLSDHDDGWGVGIGGGLIFFVGGPVGLVLGYHRLELLPRSFCADLGSCNVDGFDVGLVLGF